MRKESRRWIERAESDWLDGKFNLEAGRANTAAFLFQQATEKALKALQIEKLGRFDRTHNLIELAKSLKAAEKFIDAAEKINPIYTIARYPDAEETIEIRDAENISELSKEVIEWVKKSLKK